MLWDCNIQLWTARVSFNVSFGDSLALSEPRWQAMDSISIHTVNVWSCPWALGDWTLRKPRSVFGRLQDTCMRLLHTSSATCNEICCGFQHVLKVAMSNLCVDTGRPPDSVDCYQQTISIWFSRWHVSIFGPLPCRVTFHSFSEGSNASFSKE